MKTQARSPFLAPHHQTRINRVLEYIDRHLEEDLNLKMLAEVGAYSPYHFHRLFKAALGETVQTYLMRKRVEKAAGILLRRPEVRIRELSLSYGFSSNSSFTRAFKKFYGVSPRQFRAGSPGQFSKIGLVDRKNGQVRLVLASYLADPNQVQKLNMMYIQVAVRLLSPMPLAYIRHVGPCEVMPQLYGRLMAWAGTKGLWPNPESKMITIYHDSPQITDPSRVRQSAGMLLKEAIPAEGEIGSMTIGNGKYLVGELEIGLNEFEKAWIGLFMQMKERGLQKREQDVMEIFHNNPEEHPEKKCRVDFCIPVQ